MKILLFLLLLTSCASYNSKRDAATNAKDCAKKCRLGTKASFNSYGVCECNEF